MNELDRREDPTTDENIPGCAMVDSCSNILTGMLNYERGESENDGKVSNGNFLVFSL